MVDLKTLKMLVKLMSDNELTELDLEDKEGEKIKLKRGNGSEGGVQYIASPQAAAPAPPPTQAAAAPAAPAGESPAAEAEAAVPAGLVEIKSPMVGTFYSSSSPDAAAFVSAGASVSADTVVCLVEAMKVFNEIKAEMSGTIEKVLVESGDAVEFGQPLFLVKP